MFRFYVLLLAAFAAWPAASRAQGLAGYSAESVIPMPQMRDSLRLWHRYITDSSVVLLVPREANPWLRRSYEFLIPLGRVSNPIHLSASLEHRDSLMISCAASDYLINGYRLLFCREGSGFSFRAAQDFQLFRSGVERICQVPLRTIDKADRRVVSPRAGTGSCSYIYHRNVLTSFPQAFTLAPAR